MRVAIVSEWYKPRLGGIEIFLADLTAKLQAAGDEIAVFTPVPGPVEINGVRITRLVPDGGYRFPPPLSANNAQDFLFQLSLLAGSRPRAMDQLRVALQSGGYDVVHVQMGNTPFTYLAVNLCIELGLPVVSSLHATLNRIEQPLFGIAAKLLRCDRWPGRVVLTAPSTAAAEARRVMYGDAPLRIVPNAIDAAYWSAVRERRTARRPGPKLELLSALRLHPRKRPMLLLDAVEALPQDIPVHLRIAGDGPLRQPLAQRISDVSLSDRIELCGQQSREPLATMMAGADLFLMPTRHESFGIAVLEARMAGVPVLAMQSSGARDFLKPNVDSLLVSDDREFLAALRRFATDRALRQRLTAGAAAPLAGYGWNDVVALYRRSYADAIALLGKEPSRTTREWSE
jgi:glycosyltransferase involved in cell wall biosynthesis